MEKKDFYHFWYVDDMKHFFRLTAYSWKERWRKKREVADTEDEKKRRSKVRVFAESKKIPMCGMKKWQRKHYSIIYLRFKTKTNLALALYLLFGLFIQ